MVAERREIEQKGGEHIEKLPLPVPHPQCPGALPCSLPLPSDCPDLLGLPGHVPGMFWQLEAGAVALPSAQKAPETAGFRGGRWWDRTTDPYDVNVVLSR